MSHWGDRRFRVLVTKRDIAAGKPQDGSSCPFAIAASRAFGFPVSVDAVGQLYRYGLDMNDDAFARIPNVGGWITQFDGGRGVWPIVADVVMYEDAA